MIELNHTEQSRTFLALLNAWEVPPEKESPEAVAKHEMARLIAFHLDDAAGVLAAAMCLEFAKLELQARGADHRFWAVDMDSLTALLGSAEGASLAAGCAGYWPSTCANSGKVEWSDAGGIGGPRNVIDVAEFGASDDA